jgi:hypothetical protein
MVPDDFPSCLHAGAAMRLPSHGCLICTPGTPQKRSSRHIADGPSRLIAEYSYIGMTSLGSRCPLAQGTDIVSTETKPQRALVLARLAGRWKS